MAMQMKDIAARNRVAETKEVVARFADLKEMCRKFVSTYEKPTENPHPVHGNRKYKALLQLAANRQLETLFIDLNDLDAFCKKEMLQPDMAVADKRGIGAMQLQGSIENWIDDIENNTLRHIPYFFQACHEELPPADDDSVLLDAKEVTSRWREQMLEDEHAGNPAAIVAAKAHIPIRLKSHFEVRFKPRDTYKATRMREVEATKVGATVMLDCMVVRTSAVKPKIEVVTYRCETCNSEIFQTVEGAHFQNLKECPSQRCKDNQTPGKLMPMIRTSKFNKYQEVRIQELSGQVPVGGVPRGMNLLVSGDNCRQVLPGDSVTVFGVFSPTELPWYQSHGNKTLQKMHLDVHHMQKHKSGYAERTDDEELERMVDTAIADGEMYEKAARSIAPEIFGHADVKKALLLVLIGSFTETMKDGMKIRGDIHGLLMGDPGVAKSQLVKQVCNIAPRAVYTTGKGSSGVGLTATVLRDPSTSEVTLEGGALVLADMGVCCIDEFDKMEESDRTAIHEVMEQQSISIAKSGITTTLNCRTTILAAANPKEGRYNPAKSPVENIDLPPALLSRFDLIFLLLDTVDIEKDMNLARHVTKVHACYDSKKTHTGAQAMDEVYQFEAYDAEFLRTYIRKARQLKPLIDDELQKDIVAAYVSMRSSEHEMDRDERKAYTTPRTLLAILRLSQAHARARLSDRVNREDFDEAIRLMQASKESVELAAPAKRGANPLDLVYDIIKEQSDRAESGDGWVDMTHVVSLAGYKAMSKEQVEEAIENWESLSVMYRNPEKTKVKFSVPE